MSVSHLQQEHYTQTVTDSYQRYHSVFFGLPLGFPVGTRFGFSRCSGFFGLPRPSVDFAFGRPRGFPVGTRTFLGTFSCSAFFTPGLLNFLPSTFLGPIRFFDLPSTATILIKSKTCSEKKKSLFSSPVLCNTTITH